MAEEDAAASDGVADGALVAICFGVAVFGATELELASSVLSSMTVLCTGCTDTVGAGFGFGISFGLGSSFFGGSSLSSPSSL